MTIAKTRLPIYIAIALVAVAIISYFTVSAISKANNSPEKLLSLGEKYLTELQYEEALVQFLKVIEIEPMNERAYLATAEAYVGLGQTDKAIEILGKGLEALQESAAIKAMLEELLPPPELAEVASVSEAEPEPEVDFTGFEPFTILDVEKMGLFHGMTIYDLVGIHGITTEDVNRKVELIEINGGMKDGRTTGYSSGSWTMDKFVFDLNPDNYLKVLCVADIIGGDTLITSTIQWPRNLSLGSPTAEVFDQFAIPGSKAQKFILDPTRSNLIDLGAEEYSNIVGQSYLHLSDSVQISTGNRQLNIRSGVYIFNDSGYDYDVTFFCNEDDDHMQDVWVSFESKDGFIQGIEIHF